MAWTTPRTWVSGELVTAALMNSALRDNLNMLDGGRLAIASQAAGDVVYASSSTALARLAADSGKFLKSGASSVSWESAGANSSPYITAAVGSDALTISVVSAAAAAPSSAAPVDIVFRNVTPATGSPTTISLTGATTLVIPSGATMGASSGVTFRLWVCAFNDAGTVRLAALNCRAASGGIYSLSAYGISTSATIGTGSDNTQTFYGSTGVTDKAFTILGYVTYESGLSTAGTYDAAPTVVQTFGPGVAPPGAILQSKRGHYSTETSSSSSTMAATGLAVAITPLSKQNAIRASVAMGTCQKHTGNAQLRTGLYRDTTLLISPTITAYTTGSTTQNSGAGPSVEFMDTPYSTSSVSYNMQFASGTNIAAVVVQLGSADSMMVLEEVQG
jgi:hypothetical protein